MSRSADPIGDFKPFDAADAVSARAERVEFAEARRCDRPARSVDGRALTENRHGHGHGLAKPERVLA